MVAALRTSFRPLKSTPPSNSPIGGISTSPTRELTILPNEAPTMIPTAMSTALPLTAKSLNSLIIDMQRLLFYSNYIIYRKNPLQYFLPHRVMFNLVIYYYL